jgi:hypothetical protein
MAGGLDEVRHYLSNAAKSFEQLRSAKTAGELRDSWESFLGHFAKCIGRLIDRGASMPKARPWAHRLKNASNGGDSGLTFLREARNIVEHGLEPVARFAERYVDVGGGFAAIEGGTITITNCTFNGRPTGDFTVGAKDGQVVSLKGEPNVPIFQMPAKIGLVPVKNVGKSITVPVPTTLMGVPIALDSPVELARVGIDFLNKSCAELTQLS